MNSDDSSTEDTGLELPVVGDGEGLPPHPEPSFDQMLAHARLLLSWQSEDFFEKRRARMQTERFFLD